MREKDDSLSELSKKLDETNTQLSSTKQSLVEEQEKVKIQETQIKEMNERLHKPDRQSSKTQPSQNVRKSILSVLIICNKN